MAEETTTAPESAAPAAPVTTGARTIAGGGISIEDQLAEINALRKSDPKAYWSDETQSKQLGLIRAQQARADASATLVGEAMKSLDEIDKELKEIDQLRRVDRRAYDKDPSMQDKELKLLEAKEVAIDEGKTLEACTPLLIPSSSRPQIERPSRPSSTRCTRQCRKPRRLPYAPCSAAT